MKELTPRMLELLYVNFITGYSDNEYRRAYRASIKQNIADSDLKDMNYSDEEIEEINAALAAM